MARVLNIWGWSVLVLAIGVLLATTGCSAVATLSDEMSAEGVESVRVEVERGRVELYALDCLDDIKVEGEFVYYVSSESAAQEKADRIRLNLYTQGTEAIIELDIPPHAEPVSPLLAIGIPEGLSADVRTHDGGVYVEGLVGDLAVETTNGTVDLLDIEGDVRVETTNGRIEIAAVDGAVWGKTTNGTVGITDHRGDIDVSTTNGQIDLETELLAGGSCVAHTTNGRIDLSVPQNTSASLNATTTNGGIALQDLEFDGVIHDWEAVGILGAGDGVIAVSTTNGEVTVSGRCDGGDGWMENACGEESAAAE